VALRAAVGCGRDDHGAFRMAVKMLVIDGLGSM